MSGEALATAKKLLSWHYLAGAGAQLWEGIGEQVDAAAQLLRQAWRVRLPRLAPPDALPLLSDMRNLDYPPRMAQPAIRDRLQDPWGLWDLAGGRVRLLDELATWGLQAAEVVSWRDLSNQGIPQAFGGDSSCFFIRVNQPNPWRPASRWDSGVLWDQPQLWWDAGRHDPELWAAVKRIIEKWKPAAASCRFVEIVLKVDIFGNPTEVARAPIHEWWELDARGNAPNYYNEGYL